MSRLGADWGFDEASIETAGLARSASMTLVALRGTHRVSTGAESEPSPTAHGWSRWRTCP